jgi:hypothetical protein
MVRSAWNFPITLTNIVFLVYVHIGGSEIL